MVADNGNPARLRRDLARASNTGQCGAVIMENTTYGQSVICYGQHGEVRLDNPAAKAVAEKIVEELWREFHPTSVLKIGTKIERAIAREMKTAQVAYQAAKAAEGALL